MVFEQFEFLHVNEAAFMLRVSAMTIYKLIHQQELDAFKTGREWKISLNSLLNYIEKQKNNKK